MASLSALRAGLKARLDTIAGLNAYAHRVDDIVSPAAVVLPETINYRDTFDGKYSYLLVVQLFVEWGTSPAVAEDLMSDYLDSTGATSIIAAIEADGTLGGLADYTEVTTMRDYGKVEYAAVDYLSCDLVVGVSV